MVNLLVSVDYMHGDISIAQPLRDGLVRRTPTLLIRLPT